MCPQPRNPQNKRLPRRWRYRHNFYWYRVPPGLESLWDNCTEYKLGRTEAEAYQEWARRMASTQPVDAATIGDLFDRMLVEEIPDMPRRRSETYILAYRRLRPVFGNVRVDGVVPKDALRYLDLCARQVQAESDGKFDGLTTCRRDFEVLSATLTQAVLWGLINGNPLLGVRKPRKKPRKRFLEAWEVGEILNLGADGNLPTDARRLRTIQIGKLYVVLKLMTGLRRKDLLTLQLDQITDAGLLVTHSKTAGSSGKTTLYEWDQDGLLREVVRLLQTMSPTNRAPFLIVTRKGTTYYNVERQSAPAFDSMWQRFMGEVLTRTKITESFQERDLRATTASLSETLEVARARLGHTTSATTNTVYRRSAERVAPLIMPDMLKSIGGAHGEGSGDGGKDD